MSPALRISRLTARRFQRRLVLLDEPVATIGAALSHLGYVQIDPINICGRMHDLILRHRVVGYREGDLMRHLHGDESALRPEERRAVEHHVPHTNILVAFPLEAWPHLLGAMHRRSRSTGPWSGKLTPRERVLAEHILSEIKTRGALASESIADSRKARRAWGSATLAKSTLQKLFFHGRVLISRRIAQRRLYDLPERVLPSSVLAAGIPPAIETTRWLALLKLRQRRLVTLKREEARTLEDLIQPVEITDYPTTDAHPPLYCLIEDLPTLEAVQRETVAPAETVHLLAPLDPLIYDRRVTSALWDFDYTWEAYTPAHKRVRGYYALPILSGLELVGHVDAKADRKAGKLTVVSRSARRGHRVADATRHFARWLGLK
ncbi:MAG: crosslink repair DNA glycosylase YcaQ family protein [Opitutus sp.]